MTLAADYDAYARGGMMPVAAAPMAAINPAIVLRPCQQAAFDRFAFYMRDGNPAHPAPAHLLFHMATGSGKTVVMALLIAELYARGHRNFLFFVNSDQIIKKTKANFLEPSSAKYLFADPVRIGGEAVRVREIASFDEADTTSINIVFTTIQGLHSRLENPAENSVTYEDFAGRRIVLISDEAHHLNAATKAGTQGDLLETSWEQTVARVFAANAGNLLLEFTATVDLRQPAIAEKYDDKILFDYTLRTFREERYSKEIIVREVDRDPVARMLQAAVLSQMRRKLAEADGIPLKPVVLMKSRTIAESAANEAAFHAEIAALDGAKLTAMTAAAGDATLTAALAYVLVGMNADDFTREVKADFAPEKVRNVNSGGDLERRQIELNNLEHHDNEVRAIFAVNKLDEGWDVLNLFDIVRLYDTRSVTTTNAEAQLIGRGARYCPFAAPGDPAAARDRRKYDDDLTNPLRRLEELFYHCAHNPPYIADIKKALRDSGIMADDTRQVTLRFKQKFRDSDFFKTEAVMINRRIVNDRAGMAALADYAIPATIRLPDMMTGRVRESTAFGAESGLIGAELVMRAFPLAAFAPGVVRHAMNGDPFFRFDTLRRHFPQLGGISDFIASPSFLGGVTVEVHGLAADLDALGPRDRLWIAQTALKQIAAGIELRSVEHQGSREFAPHAMSALFADDNTITVPLGSSERSKGWRESEVLQGINLLTKGWHVFEDNYGTSEEKHFIRWLNDRAAVIQARFAEFYLLRNEGQVKLFAFTDGAGFQPDFLLFLRDVGDGRKTILQLFIEPKNLTLADGADHWKETFLTAIGETGQWNAFHGKDYRVVGLPFFNNAEPRRGDFAAAFGAATEPA